MVFIYCLMVLNRFSLSKVGPSLRLLILVDRSSVVAIHGFNGDPFKTWTHKESDVLWLRDLLPEELPNARIMTYGYNARFKNFTTHQDLRTIAAKLITELVDVRKPDVRKPDEVCFRYSEPFKY